MWRFSDVHLKKLQLFACGWVEVRHVGGRGDRVHCAQTCLREGSGVLLADRRDEVTRGSGGAIGVGFGVNDDERHCSVERGRISVLPQVSYPGIACAAHFDLVPVEASPCGTGLVHGSGKTLGGRQREQLTSRVLPGTSMHTLLLGPRHQFFSVFRRGPKHPFQSCANCEVQYSYNNHAFIIHVRGLQKTL